VAELSELWSWRWMYQSTHPTLAYSTSPPLIEPGVEDVCVDAFGLVEIDDRLDQHVVVGVADRSDRAMSSARARASPKRIEMYR
jgi:hypothetical protein